LIDDPHPLQALHPTSLSSSFLLWIMVPRNEKLASPGVLSYLSSSVRNKARVWAQTPAFDHLHTNNLSALWHSVGPQPTVPGHGSVAQAKDGSSQAKPAQGQEKALVGNASCAASQPQEQGDIPVLHS